MFAAERAAWAQSLQQGPVPWLPPDPSNLEIAPTDTYEACSYQQQLEHKRLRQLAACCACFREKQLEGCWRSCLLELYWQWCRSQYGKLLACQRASCSPCICCSEPYAVYMDGLHRPLSRRGHSSYETSLYGSRWVRSLGVSLGLGIACDNHRHLHLIIAKQAPRYMTGRQVCCSAARQHASMHPASGCAACWACSSAGMP